MQLLDRLRPHPVSQFAGITLVIWGNRVWLAWTDPKLDLTDKLGYSVPITAFVVAALVTLGLQLSNRTGSRGFRSLVAAFAGGTVLYWAVRLPMILLRHHSFPFKLVHTVLAAVLIGSAIRAVHAIRVLGQGPGAAVKPRPRNRVSAVNQG